MKIEKNIPVPKNKPGTKASYPLDKLKVRESFLIPDIDSGRAHGLLNVRAKAMGIKITCRNEYDKLGTKIIGARVWRLK